MPLTQRLSKGTEGSNGFVGQNDIEPKLNTVSLVRQTMLSNSSVRSSLSNLLFSDGPRQKEFAGTLNRPPSLLLFCFCITLMVSELFPHLMLQLTLRKPQSGTLFCRPYTHLSIYS